MTDCTQPPPNNAGLNTGAAGGYGHINWNTNTPAPKKKTLEFENLTCTYEQEAGILTVASCGTKMTFDVKEQSELRAALAAFGLGQPAGSTVNYR